MLSAHGPDSMQGSIRLRASRFKDWAALSISNAFFEADYKLLQAQSADQADGSKLNDIDSAIAAFNLADKRLGLLQLPGKIHLRDASLLPRLSQKPKYDGVFPGVNRFLHPAPCLPSG
jgi:hypothetical protein